MLKKNILVSAIVSVYNSSRFIKGCLDDLTNQSLFKKGQMEIILIDACSKEDEYSIIKDYISDNIIYRRLQQKTTVYGAWNEGIILASGKYITNANTDDRHREDALEIMAQSLESMADIVLVYADVFVTNKDNEAFSESQQQERIYWYDWDRDILLHKGSFIGPQPMWRKEIHEEFGLFDKSLVVSGDAEFWLRISQRHKFYHLKEPLGLYLKRQDSLEHSNHHRRDFENIRIITMYREAHQKREIIRIKPTKGIMEFDNDLLTIITITSNQESFDSMIEMIKSFTKYSFEIINLDSSLTNIGYLLNLAIAKAQGQYIAIIDDSIIITDNTFDYLLRQLKGDIQIAFPLCQWALNYDTLPYSDLQQLRQFSINWRERHLYRKIINRGINIPCLVININAFSKLGPFDERLKSLRGVLDDFSIRAKIRGCNILLSADVFVHSSKKISILEEDKSLLNEKWGNIVASSEEGKRLLSIDTSEKAMELFLKGSLDRAVKQLFDYLSIIPDDILIKKTLIKILYHASRYEDVIKITVDKNDEETSIYECFSLIATERLKEATNFAFQKINNQAIRKAILGTIEINKGDHKEGEKLLSEGLQLQPDIAFALKQLGYLQYSKGIKKTGFINVERAFVVDPENMKISEAYHFLISIEGLYERAETMYRETFNLYPYCKHILSLLIDTLLKQNKYLEAMSEIEKMILDFEIDDETLNIASSIRQKIGPLNNNNSPSLSVCMIVKNEEANILNALMSVKPLCKEIIVVDTGSSDRTKLLAQIYGAHVYDFVWNNNYADARNYSLSKARGEWILVIDADEIISPSDYEIIKGLLDDKSLSYQVITRNYTFDRSILGFIENDGSYKEEKGYGWMPTIKIRLFPRLDSIYFEGKVHELVDQSVKSAQLDIKTAPFVIHHYGKLDYTKDRKKGEYYYNLGLQKLKDNENDPKAIKELAIVAGGIGRIDEGIDLWNKYLSIKKDDFDAMLNLLGLYTFKNEHQKIKEIANQILQIDPQNKIALKSLNTTKVD